MFYVKIDESEHSPGELIVADSGNLRWSRVYVEESKTDDSGWDVLGEIAKITQLDFSTGYVGDMTPQHPDGGRTVNYVHWFNKNFVGHLVATTQTIYILNENGKTLDRV